MDEAGIDDNETYPYGWTRKGKRLYGMKKGVKTKRLSIASALSRGKLCASFIFEGSCDRNVFETYVEKILVPILNPGQVVVLDNASFHHGGNIKQLIENAHCELLYLPSYSPDFNPIEHYWSALKNKIRRNLNSLSCDLYDAAILAFNDELIY